MLETSEHVRRAIRWRQTPWPLTLERHLFILAGVNFIWKMKDLNKWKDCYSAICRASRPICDRICSSIV